MGFSATGGPALLGNWQGARGGYWFNTRPTCVGRVHCFDAPLSPPRCLSLRGAYYTASMSSLHSLAFLSLHRVMFVACFRQWRERFSDTLKCQSCSDIPLSREVVITTILPFLSQIYLCVWFLCQFTSRCSQDCSAFFRRYRLCSLQRFLGQEW